MNAGIPRFPQSGRSSFAVAVSAFLAQPGLPFAELRSAERMHRIFAKHDNLFGARGVYSTAVMVWSFLGQVLRDGKEASCQAAVARVTNYCQQQGETPPTSDTGDYCRARAKLSEAALHEVSCEVASELEEAAEESWLWNGKHAKLIDGFTFTMPDTPTNQAEYPQAKTQAVGVGLPIARAVAITSLATGCVMDAALGPYAGKETGETALLRSMLGSLGKEDVAVMDRYYCSFMMIGLLLNRGVQVCARKHHKRHTDFRKGLRLGKDDHLILWDRPMRPKWMDEETYEQIPQSLILREIRYQVVEPGCRTKSVVVITTMIDPEAFPAEELAQLYGFRWNSELDIRHLKDSLNLAHVRCHSPAMVRRELWTTLLAYNLIRTTVACAALLHEKAPRQLSFTSACQYVLAWWMLASCNLIDAAQREAHLRGLLKQIANCEVANRPGRLEPRVIKRRRHGYKLMQKPREKLRQELRKRST